MTDEEERIWFDYHQPAIREGMPPDMPTWLMVLMTPLLVLLSPIILYKEGRERGWWTVERFLLWKRYFEIGTTLTTPLKGLLLLFGVTSRNVGLTFQFAALYGVVTFLAGWLWHRYGLMRREFVIMNSFNDLADDVREMKRAS